MFLDTSLPFESYGPESTPTPAASPRRQRPLVALTPSAMQKCAIVSPHLYDVVRKWAGGGVGAPIFNGVQTRYLMHTPYDTHLARAFPTVYPEAESVAPRGKAWKIPGNPEEVQRLLCADNGMGLPGQAALPALFGRAAPVTDEFPASRLLGRMVSVALLGKL